MIRSKLGVLGVCAVVLGVMAIGVSGAQAEGTWLVLTSGGVNKTGSELKSQVVGSIENNDGSLLTKLLGLTVKVLCTGMTLEGLFLEGTGSLTKGFSATFSGCETFINGVLEESCTPNTAGTAAGTMKSGKLKGLAVLIGGSKRVRIEPEVAGSSFKTITFSNEECVLPSIPVFGVIYVKDCKGDTAFSEHLVKHLHEEDSVNTKLWVISDTAEHLETKIDGSAEEFLTGAHTGLKWGGDV